MDVEANGASENLEELLSGIDEQVRWGDIYVELDDSQADRYDFANEILTRRMRDSLESFFGSIFNLPVLSIDVGGATDNTTESPAITISTSALLETLPHLHESLEGLHVSNFDLTCQSDVKAVANIIATKCATLDYLNLTSINCPVHDCNMQGSNEFDGFLDPLFNAASGLDSLCITAKTRSVHSTLVSPRALRALFAEGQLRTLDLCGLGLTDSHVLAIVDGLSTPGTHLGCLDLHSNPGISAQGYDALFNLISQANVVGFVVISGEWFGFRVDDKAWEGKLNLVSEMNSKYRRLEYLTNGTFTSEERRWQWLERVANLPGWIMDDEDEEYL